jgi:hypothetical protein
VTTGAQVFSNPTVLYTNFYSANFSDYSVVNHHWLSGVVFAGAYRLGGFPAISVLSIGVGLMTFWFFLRIATLTYTFGSANLAAIIALPLLASRTEPRPELFTYACTGIFIYVLTLKPKWIPILPLIQVLWTNLHIFFPLGPAIMAVWLLLSGQKIRSSAWAWFIATVLATTINPNGVTGALMPFTIMNNYGYPLLENRALWLSAPNLFPIVLFAWNAMLVIVITQATHHQRQLHRVMIRGIGFMLCACGVVALRNLPLLGFGAMLLVPEAFIGNNINRVLGYMSVGIVVVLLAMYPGIYSAPRNIGLDHDSKQALSYLSTHPITAPLFNDYDIGGFIIFADFPHTRVFVDNRPEAYPASFFTDTYIPMQQGSSWQQRLNGNDFRTIIFSKRDATVWGRLFLSARIRDPVWRTAFENDSLIILERIP